jgi:hypothetical protein
VPLRVPRTMFLGICQRPAVRIVLINPHYSVCRATAGHRSADLPGTIVCSMLPIFSRRAAKSRQSTRLKGEEVLAPTCLARSLLSPLLCIAL